ncbi:DUF1077-domain-containing protein [Sistotremastrum niveocremeum HHB9708]|uniref:ER membrane protein complex subunit 4 n=1 Tax=Sistotremastrum niveocremeum HHB9708 TaxID=1314777 RepID=A0A165ADE2_9AGAM|nr:DUF1077-domain-containing protein [Sistotremastrum niveocremeum HHB9708]
MKLDYSNVQSKWNNLPAPPGFGPIPSTKKVTKSSTAAAASQAALKQKRAWDHAISPAKQLPMQAVMLYMSGGGVQLFSMGIVFMLLINPFKAVSTINKSFAPFAPAKSDPTAFTTLLLQKVAFIACNILTLALGLWKCSSMGLLPMGTGDWLAFETRGQPPELTLL